MGKKIYRILRGPSMNIRPKQEQCLEWVEKAGFINPQKYDLKPYRYGLVLIKEEFAK